jgi:ATP-dependent HslUV protease subunit HslV
LALIDVPGIGAEEIARKAMKIAGDKCCFTNHTIRVESIHPPVVAVPLVVAST